MGSIAQNSKRSITAEDISTLQSLLAKTNPTLLTPEDDKYPASIARWSAAAQKPAGLVLAPKSNEEISIAVKYASEQNIDVAVKGGGHSTAGVSSTDGGLLIDLNANLRNVEVEVEKKLLRIQGGCTWGDVDNAGAKHGLATVGGTVADTGVGGLTLGGGYGFLSGQHGLTIDNLVEATVVLASGEVVKASKSENADLFWALSGAGQNFGVVTEFVLQAYDQGEVWAGMLIFPPTPEVVEKLVAALNDLYTVDSSGKTKSAGRAAGGLVFMKPPPTFDQVALAVPTIYFGTEAEAKEIFKDLYAIGPLADTAALVPYPVLNTLMAPPIGLRASMKGAAFTMPLRTASVQDMLSNFIQFTADNEDAKGSIIFYEMLDTIKVTEFDAGSFANRGPHMNALIMPLWTKTENDQAYRKWARDVNVLFKEELQRSGHDTGKGVEGGVGIRGSKGAVLLYGNYDREFPQTSLFHLPPRRSSYADRPTDLN